MFDVAALGEALIDFTPSGVTDLGLRTFARNPGGAPLNVLAMAAKLGAKTAFIGKVGDDDFGYYLKKVMENASIDLSGLSMTKDYRTTLAFVHLNDSGECSFSFYRKQGADIFLRADEVKESILENCKIFHFGSVSLTDEPSRSATLYAAGKAKSSGAVISFDPNYRPLLWDSEDSAKAEILNALPLADIVKVSEDELALITGETDLPRGAARLAAYGASLVIVTLGPKGAFYYNGASSGLMPTYAADTVDTTGAGDAFLGALLFNLRNVTVKGLQTMPDAELRRFVAFSNAAGSLTTAKKGAIPAMPMIAEIEHCMNNVHILEFKQNSTEENGYE